MKLISLNIWAGHERIALFEFLAAQKNSTDIFCFQEVWTSPASTPRDSNGANLHIFTELVDFFPEFSAHFFPVQNGYDLLGRTPLDTTLGQAMFVKNGIAADSLGNEFVYLSENAASGDDWVNFPASFSYVRTMHEDKPLTVINFHGKAFPADKLDTPERIEASQKIIEFAKGEKGEVVIMGDFNLMPETKSIALFQQAGFRNLITEYGIAITRSTINPYYGTPEQQNFADYTFVSPSIMIKNFSVPSECVASDHLPMILEIG